LNATLNPGPFTVTASNALGTSAGSQFNVVQDAAPPSTTALCNGGSCAGPFSAPVSVSLTSTDPAGSGVQAIYYTVDGSDPTSASPVYNNGPFTVATLSTVKFFAVDNVANAEAVQSLTVGGGGGGGGGPVALVQQKTAGGSGVATLPVTLDAPSGAGNTLVATIGLAAGSSASVSSVTDSSSATWTKGPVGFQSGSNSRVETWYRLGGPSVSGVTVNLSIAKSAAVTVSEWSGVGSVVDVSANGNGASATSVATPSLTTLNANDLVIAAINYHANTTATLASSGFTSLNDFTASTSVHGRAAYLRTTTTGSYQALWSLPVVSGGHGSAILALKAA
jgi:hypothetical protein